MPKHKLYRDSLQSFYLNSSMENKGDQNVSPISSKGNDKMGIIEDFKGKDKSGICLSQNSSKSDDSLDDNNFVTEFLEKRSYSLDEDIEIINFVLKDQNIYRVSSVLLWKYLEAKKRNPKRTYQSLKNRFLRNIKPKLFTTYRHLIQNEEQIKKILDKFPELRKDAKNTLPVLRLNSVPRKADDQTIENQTPKVKKTSARIRPLTSTEKSTSPVEKESGRGIKFFNNSILVTVPRNLITDAPSSFERMGIYEKYSNCKAKNKLVPCPTCGRCGGPESNEVQDSENENDIVISNSIGSENSESSRRSANSIKDKSSGKGVTVKKVQGGKRKNSSSANTSTSPSFLDGIQCQNGREVEKQNKRRCQEEKYKSTSVTRRKHLTRAEQVSQDLTGGELESLYQEMVQECQNFISSDEEEALVKKCFKKNRRSIGFDSYVLLEKLNLDSFFAKSQSPPLDSLSADPVPSAENKSEEIQNSLVENMRKMMRSRSIKKS